MADSPEPAAKSSLVDGIPVVWVSPRGSVPAAPLALWLPALGFGKELVVPFLDRLADAGFLAISLDLWQHGERGTESTDEIWQRVFGNYRRYKWPIVGQTTLDCLRVIDWAQDSLAAGTTVVAGGVSLGGDVAVALAGIDARVSRVAALIASPDWTSPGMHSFDDPPQLLPQGEPDAYAQWFYDQLDPLSHLDRYARGPAIAFESGADDTHVPVAGAQRFQTALKTAYPEAADQVRITAHPGVGHLNALEHPEPQQHALDWLRLATQDR